MRPDLNPSQCESKMDSFNDYIYQGYVGFIKLNPVGFHLLIIGNFISPQPAFLLPFLDQCTSSS